MTKDNFKVKVISFGYKYKQMPSANLVFDLRFLDNPYWNPDMRLMTGLDQEVQNYVWQVDGAESSYSTIKQLVDQTLPLYIKKADKKQVLNPEIVIAFGCTSGQHRSVVFAERLVKELSLDQYQVSINHLNMEESLEFERVTREQYGK